MEDFQAANSPKDSGFPALPANFRRQTPLRIANVNLNENINRFFDSDFTFGHELEELLPNKSNKSKHKQTSLLVSLSAILNVVILCHTVYSMA